MAGWHKSGDWATRLEIQLEIVRRRDAHAFEILSRRWVIEAAWPG